MAAKDLRSLVLRSAAGLLVLAALVAALAWRVEGGRWYDVRSASMGTAAPIGTLLLTRPTTLADVAVGDLITFRSPGSGVVYSHRVIEKTADGLRTQGDVNPAADAWTLGQGDLVGKVVRTVPGAGWLLRGLPLLLLCVAVTWLVSSLVRPERRDTVRVLAASLSLGVVGLVLRPWVGLERLGSTEAEKGVVVRVISTGLLPIKASATQGGGSTRLVNGAVGDVHVVHAGARGAYGLDAVLSLSWPWWIALGVLAASPLLWCLVRGLSPEEDPEATHEETTGETFEAQVTARAPGRHARTAAG